MNWVLHLSISAIILSYANAWMNKYELEESGVSQKTVPGLSQNFDHPKSIAASNNVNDRLDVIERELQTVKEENKILKGHVLDLKKTMKLSKMINLDVPGESGNGTIKLTKKRSDDGQINSVDGILSISPGSRMNAEGLYITRQNDQGPVAFFAQLSDTLTSLGLNQIIHFNYVVTNIGGGYHPLFGIFIAPVKGLYVFHVRAMVRPEQRQYLTIVRDGIWMQPLYADAGGDQHFVIDSVTIVLEVEKGSAVWVRAESGSGYLHGNRYSVFSGWLLSRL
ncbi:hypothetical protein CHS0354_002635 [Potamilus streckersoni]|uniref:C1q domain-containing protein n=1 Tax=Potamilus streckersoni TaxID=2493646 RepID=A0AAE0VGK2_9BIVA|nr:hypothetical protein CHS0354_002635 [Potamilus streckersoni]